jgi:hypothetical protein
MRTSLLGDVLQGIEVPEMRVATSETIDRLAREERRPPPSTVLGISMGRAVTLAVLRGNTRMWHKLKQHTPSDADAFRLLDWAGTRTIPPRDELETIKVRPS